MLDDSYPCRPFKCWSRELSKPAVEGGEPLDAAVLLEVCACGGLPVVGDPVGGSAKFIRAASLATSSTCLVSWSTSVAAEEVWPFVHAWLPELAVFAILISYNSRSVVRHQGICHVAMQNHSLFQHIP